MGSKGKKTCELKAVLCDLGGVIALFDEETIRKRLEGIARRSLEEPEVGPAFLEELFSFERGELGPEEFFQRTKELLEVEVPFEEFVRVWEDNFWLNPKAVEELERLRGRFRLVLVSNTDPLHWRHIDRTFGIGRLFDELVLSYEVGAIKPDRKMFEVALEKAGVEPPEALYVDDLEENVRAAAEVGMHTLLYRPDRSILEAVRSHGCEL
ncbi:MAG: HAD family phosphatase [Calditrichaeota bacterium]|nr:HAD family phosphatase [Calditrichota bacterium]